MYKTYKVIKKSNWTDSKGKARNFYVYVRGNSIEEATRYSLQKWGSENIKEVIESPDWFVGKLTK